LRKQIAGALVLSLLIGSAPGWADDENAKKAPTADEGAQRGQLRDSIDRALDVKPAQGSELTAGERRDLETRRANLKTDPVASGGAGILMSLVATAASIGLTIYLLKKTKESTTIPSMGRP
jgi:hypothetical protein